MSETLTEDKQTINTLDVSEGNLNAIVDDGFDVIEDSEYRLYQKLKNKYEKGSRFDQAVMS